MSMQEQHLRAWFCVYTGKGPGRGGGRGGGGGFRAVVQNAKPRPRSFFPAPPPSPSVTFLCPAVPLLTLFIHLISPGAVKYTRSAAFGSE